MRDRGSSSSSSSSIVGTDTQAHAHTQHTHTHTQDERERERVRERVREREGMSRVSWHTCLCADFRQEMKVATHCIRQHTSAHVSIRIPACAQICARNESCGSKKEFRPPALNPSNPGHCCTDDRTSSIILLYMCPHSAASTVVYLASSYSYVLAYYLHR